MGYLLDKKTLGNYVTQEVFTDIDSITYSTVKKIIEGEDSLYKFKGFTDLSTPIPSTSLENDVYYPLVAGENIGVDVTQEDLELNTIMVFNSLEFVKVRFSGLAEYTKQIFSNIQEYFYRSENKLSSSNLIIVHNDGSLSVSLDGTGGYSYCLLKNKNDKIWEENHEYYVVYDITVNEMQNAAPVLSTSLKEPTNTTVVGCSSITLPSSARSVLSTKSGIVPSDSNTGLVFFQLGVNNPTNTIIDIEIHNIMCVDLGVNNDLFTTDDIDTLINNFGFDSTQKIVSESLTSAFAKNARYAEAIAPKTELLIGVGDSLMSQNWLQYSASDLGRDYQLWAEGGKTSAYLRDLFFNNLTEENKSSTFIFNVGRNNYSNPDYVVRDVQSMIKAIEHDRFIICTPPNGGYTYEFSGYTGYNRIVEIGSRLQAEFPENFINTRDYAIEGWDMGNVKLLSSFTQPLIGATVQVEVSDTSFISVFNASDIASYPTRNNKISIGTRGVYDTYLITSVDSSTLLTIESVTQDRILAGSSVGNENSPDGSTYYLTVAQELDIFFKENDTTLSTYRKDSIHLKDNEKSLRFFSAPITRKLRNLDI